MLTLFLSAFGLGLVFNAAPGAVFAETVRHGIRGGFRPAFEVQFGSLVGDATWAVLGLLSIAWALQWDALRWPLGLAGAAYLAYLSWDSWQAARTVHAVDDRGADAPSGVSPLRKGALLSLTNPQNLAYWAAVGGAMHSIGASPTDPVDLGTFFAGFMAASVIWCFICAALVDRVFRRVGAAWASFTYRLCAAALLTLALGTLRDLATSTTPHSVPATPPALSAPP